jgi:hypothetical protein
MQQKTIIIIAITVVLTASCICLIFAGGIGLGFGLTDSFDSVLSRQQPAETTSVDYQPPERPAPRGKLLLDDDFSRQHWKIYSDTEHRKGYTDGRYFIIVDAPEYSFWSIAGETYDDFVMEVETLQVEGPENNDYGVILRYQDDGNFYSFEISGDGYYTFSKLVDDELYEIIPWQRSDAIRPAPQSNVLRVEVVDANFTFYINDELVDAAIDSKFGQGDIGLVAGTYEDAGTHIAFDNLKVWAAE